MGEKRRSLNALRAAMEDVLRPLGMTVTRYSCLELLAQRPGLSNSDLARGAFVTRQSMNALLQALERAVVGAKADLHQDADVETLKSLKAERDLLRRAIRTGKAWEDSANWDLETVH